MLAKELLWNVLTVRINMKQCIIIGAGTYGQVYAKYLGDEYEVIGFIDDNPTLKGAEVENIKVIGDTSYSFIFLAENPNVFVFVPIGNNSIRQRLLKEYSERGISTPSFIHPQTIIHPTVIIGKGVYILPATNIMPDTIIGDFVMISMGVNIAHHNKIAEGCFFSQGTNIGASVKIGEQAYFGIGSTLMTGVKEVGQHSLIGAGAVVIKDVPDFAVVVGNPAKVIKYKEQDTNDKKKF
jgi:sugar O-acyltransferase (sialic acid O-acetyltransferase NeuD family)